MYKPYTHEERIQAFLAKTKRCGDCLIWTGALTRTGYGKMGICGRTVECHRFAFEAFIGPIPPGLWVRHMCATPACVNPEHLGIGTPADNRRDMIHDGNIRISRASCNVGIENPAAKLTVTQVRQIFQDPNPYPVIAETFACSKQTVCSIKLRQKWKRATEDLNGQHV